jgi:tetrahydromethanopterin S-methyltransferase subunit G
MSDKYKKIKAEENFRLSQKFDDIDRKMHKKIGVLIAILITLFLILLFVLFSNIFSIQYFM